jgi:hypothetical protein
VTIKGNDTMATMQSFRHLECMQCMVGAGTRRGLWSPVVSYLQLPSITQVPINLPNLWDLPTPEKTNYLA